MFVNSEYSLNKANCFNLGSNLSIYRNPSIHWSSDNRIAVSTNTGAYIISPQCNSNAIQTGLNVSNLFLPAEDKTLSFDVGIDKDKLLDPEQGNEVLQARVALDRTLNPDGDFTQSFKGFLSVKWSPRDMDDLERCICATLTRDHRICIYSLGKSHRKLHKVADLSRKYHALVKKNDFALAEEKTSQAADKEYEYHLYRNILYSLAAVDLSWSPNMYRTQSAKTDESPTSKVSKFCFLSTSMKDGSVVFWKIITPCIDKANCTLSMVEDTGIELPNCSCWAQVDERNGYFAIGFLDGRLLVYGYHVDDDTGDLSLTEPVDVWKDVDKLSVTDIVWDKERDLLYFGKENFALSAKLGNPAKPEMSSAVKVIHRLDVAIAGLAIHDELLIIASTESDVIMCRSSVDPEIVYSDNLSNDGKKWLCHGIAVSPNCAFLSFVQSPGFYYDHLKLRDPLKIKAISLLPKEELCQRILEERDELPFDLLEDLRYRCRAGMPLCETMEKLLSSRDEWQDISVYYHKLMRFLIRMLLNFMASAADDVKRQELENDLFIVEDLIIKHHIIEHMNSYNDIPNPGETEQLITSLMVDWCKQTSNNGERAEPSSGEQCAICTERIPLVTISQGVCPKGHSFGRCCQTLLLCQNVPYRKCMECQSVAIAMEISGSDWIKQVLKTKCTFCDGILV
ncbi:general transcription factor 3C polypeptide 4-like [Tubulanus polymorphus]|uniref:general transcription factor 3C polypeptide 4-like n=1 Tax=Tubulanus polymorphus TaxID=672921 RepID=UPI003DA5A4CF